MSVNMREIEKGLVQLERIFNVGGYLTSFSGELRMMYGSVEMAVGVALFALRGVEAAFKAAKGQRSKSLKQLARENLKYTYHGFANVTRGFIEKKSLTGALLLLLMDYYGYRLRYSVEPERSNPVIDPKTIQKYIKWFYRQTNAFFNVT